ncbi:MAG: Flp pilus assembly protein CpaB [Chloroflexi bacterium]|nr:MAG: Flp pilus assembly protein CpaB [Chloroflexota bacterium]
MQDGSKRRARLVLIVGVLLAVFAGVGTFVYASGAGGVQAAPAIPTTPVVVAAREIPAKTTITQGDLKVVEFNLDSKPGAALAKQEDAIGKVTTTPISVGEPVLLSKLNDGKTGFVVMPLDALGPDGAPKADAPFFRAFSVTVPDAEAVGGNVAPGDIIDLLVSFNFDPQKIYDRTRPTQTSDTTAKIILEKVVVLARAGAVYTIRGNTDTAERIAYLQGAGGKLSMLLRAPKDERAANTGGQTGPGVIAEYKIKVPEKVLAPAPR